MLVVTLPASWGEDTNEHTTTQCIAWLIIMNLSNIYTHPPPWSAFISKHFLGFHHPFETWNHQQQQVYFHGVPSCNIHHPNNQEVEEKAGSEASAKKRKKLLTTLPTTQTHGCYWWRNIIRYTHEWLIFMVHVYIYIYTIHQPFFCSGKAMVFVRASLVTKIFLEVWYLSSLGRLTTGMKPILFMVQISG